MTDQPTLPGMEPLSPHATPLETAAHAQLAYLEAEGLLGPHHALTVALVRQAAQVCGAAAMAGRGSAFALAAKELREAMALLPEAAGPADPFEALVDEMREAEAAARRDAAGRSS